MIVLCCDSGLYASLNYFKHRDDQVMCYRGLFVAIKRDGSQRITYFHSDHSAEQAVNQSCPVWLKLLSNTCPYCIPFPLGCPSRPDPFSVCFMAFFSSLQNRRVALTFENRPHNFVTVSTVINIHKHLCGIEGPVGLTPSLQLSPSLSLKNGAAYTTSGSESLFSTGKPHKIRVIPFI